MSLSEKVIKYISPYVETPSERYIKWLDEKNISEDIKDDLLKTCFKEVKYLGAFGEFEMNAARFFNDTSVILENTPRENDPDFSPLASKIDYLLAVGSAINGDIWAINLNNGKVEVISHDESDLYDEDEPIVVSLPVANTYSEFIEMAFEDTLPTDYYAVADELHT